MIAAVNSYTTYGIDGSVENNYGLGSSFLSSNVLAQQAAITANSLSPMWLVALLILLAVI